MGNWNKKTRKHLAKQCIPRVEMDLDISHFALCARISLRKINREIDAPSLPDGPSVLRKTTNNAHPMNEWVKRTESYGAAEMVRKVGSLRFPYTMMGSSNT